MGQSVKGDKTVDETDASGAGPVEHVPQADGSRLAFLRTPPAAAGGAAAELLFLSGFRSAMAGDKATAMHRWAAHRGLGFTRFDYRGHGRSDGDPTRLVLSDWLADALVVLDRVVQGPVILIGSSMGAWLAAKMVAARPDRIAGLITIAAAPDFTERLIRPRLTAAMRADAARTGFLTLPSSFAPDGYRVPGRLLTDGAALAVLDAPIAFDRPARLVHGLADRDVPWQLSLALAERLTGDDVQLTLIKDGGHRLSRPADLAVIRSAVSAVVERLGGRRD